MDRRKDTPLTSVNLPKDYLKLVEDLFNKNFNKNLNIEKGSKEKFIVQGEVYPDELVLIVALKNPGTLRMTTCYASVDYPPPTVTSKASSEMVQKGVNMCVDAVASFFNTFFTDGRPVDYDLEYRQGWTPVEIEKNVRVYLKINRDNPELDAQADEFLTMAEDTKKKKNLH